jgi:hypothetical protein
MKTKQTVISRFENMGRLPNYDFIARLPLALGHTPGMTLCGDYMAVVPIEKQNFIKELAEKENISTRKFIQDILPLLGGLIQAGQERGEIRKQSDNQHTANTPEVFAPRTLADIGLTEPCLMLKYGLENC